MTAPISPETQARIALFRQKAVEGTLSREDMKEAITLIRGDRRNAAAASDGARRARAKTEIKPADDMLKELGVG